MLIRLRPKKPRCGNAPPPPNYPLWLGCHPDKHGLNFTIDFVIVFYPQSTGLRYRSPTTVPHLKVKHRMSLLKVNSIRIRTCPSLALGRYRATAPLQALRFWDTVEAVDP